MRLAKRDASHPQGNFVRISLRCSKLARPLEGSCDATLHCGVLCGTGFCWGCGNGFQPHVGTAYYHYPWSMLNQKPSPPCIYRINGIPSLLTFSKYLSKICSCSVAEGCVPGVRIKSFPNLIMLWNKQTEAILGYDTFDTIHKVVQTHPAHPDWVYHIVRNMEEKYIIYLSLHSSVALPMWGVRITLFIDKRGWPGFNGSGSVTSCKRIRQDCLQVEI